MFWRPVNDASNSISVTRCSPISNGFFEWVRFILSVYVHNVEYYDANWGTKDNLTKECKSKIKYLYHAMKTYGGVTVEIRVFLTSTLVGGEWSASRPCRFIPGEKAPGSDLIEGWVDPRAGLDDMGK
jgi:hypothetical protein